MLTVNIDLMGADKPAQQLFSGVRRYANLHPNCQLNVFLTNDAFNRIVNDGIKLPINISFTVCSDQYIKATDEPAIIRHTQESSLYKAIASLAHDDRVFAIVSAANSGAYTIVANHLLRFPDHLKSSAPAFLVVIPSGPGKFILLLDAGANLNLSAKAYLEYAKQAIQYYQKLNLGVNPRVGLINIGAEANKGPQTIQEAFQLLQAQNDFLFVGNVESNQLFENKAEIFLCDGWSGNLILKSLEGAVSFFRNSLQKVVNYSLKNKLAGFLIKKDLNSLLTKYNYQKAGGAIIIGLTKPCIKLHGKSDANAFYFGLDFINRLAQNE